MPEAQQEIIFLSRARSFLTETVGVEHGELDADRDLISSGILSSLSLLSFLHFVECERGSPLPGVPELSSGFTLRSAFELTTR